MCAACVYASLQRTLRRIHSAQCAPVGLEHLCAPNDAHVHSDEFERLQRLASDAGLDSASTLTIIKSLRNVVRAIDHTIVVSLLQPEPQVRSAPAASFCWLLPRCTF